MYQQAFLKALRPSERAFHSGPDHRTGACRVSRRGPSGAVVWDKRPPLPLTVSCEDSHTRTKAHSIPARHARPQAGLGRPVQLHKF